MTRIDITAKELRAAFGKDAGTTRLPCMAIQQPYADLIVRGVKDVENRNRALPDQLRGKWCAIYASKTLAPVGSWVDAKWTAGVTGGVYAWPWDTDVNASRKQCTRGAIVGLVRWESSTKTSKSPWAQPGAHHWTYSNHVLLAEPVPLDHGFQSIYWHLDDETREAVLSSRPTNGVLYTPVRERVADLL